MINLIPAGGKKRIQREYIIRVASVWILLLSGSLLASATLLLPSYVLSLKQIQSEVASGEARAEKQETYEAMSKVLAEANTFAAQLSTSLGSVRASRILPRIEKALTPELQLLGLTVSTKSQAEKDNTVVIMQGTAETREDLQLFLQTIKKDPFWLDAQVPVSDLARDTDLAFVATLTLNPAL